MLGIFQQPDVTLCGVHSLQQSLREIGVYRLLSDPTAQLVAAGALAVMGFGYVTLNGMIAEALEA